MSKRIASVTGRVVAGALTLALAACGGDGGGPTDNDNPPAVAGTYDATFTAVQATGCLDVVRSGDSTTRPMRVTQSGSDVTLHITELRDEFGSNPVGMLSADGDFHFGPGVVIIDPDRATPGDEFNAQGTFDGTFSGDAMDIDFDFTAFTCHVVGTIVGQR
ncbi:MAG TPA: hypothetical protein VFH11_02345 [Gemmatimonadota bacterium]|nr:hypothetical protein [Gemmatimonadota bacterium]